MKIEIDESVCNKYGLTIDEILVLIGLSKGSKEIYNNLNKLRYIINFGSSIFKEDIKYKVSNSAKEIISCILAESNIEVKDRIHDIEDLADKLREIYPDGKISNTNYYYKSNRKDVVNKLKTFFKIYGTKYTDEQIINATKKYIESFNGNYTYLKLLKYFIWKDERLKGESIQSLLADFIENENCEIKSDWASLLK